MTDVYVLLTLCFLGALWVGLRQRFWLGVGGFAMLVLAFPGLATLGIVALVHAVAQPSPDWVRDLKSTWLLIGWTLIPLWLLPMVLGYLVGLAFRAGRQRASGEGVAR